MSDNIDFQLTRAINSGYGIGISGGAPNISGANVPKVRATSTYTSDLWVAGSVKTELKLTQQLTSASGTLSINSANGQIDFNNAIFNNFTVSTQRFIDLSYQTTGVMTPVANTLRVYADSTGRISWTTSSGVITTFDSSGLSANRVFTLPNASTTLVGQNTTDTLTNKTLTAPIISTISNTGTLTLPTATTTLVGRDTTDTLTNKDFSNGFTEFVGKDKSWSGSVQTTAATTETLVTVPTVTDTCMLLHVNVMAFCTVGANANTTAGQRLIVKVQNVAGTITITSASNVFSNAFATALGVFVSGTNAVVQITGLAANTINWRAYAISHNL